jgi:hypothetical protein
MKTMNIFGRNISIGLLVLGVLAVAVTASLVTYLSNTTTVTVNVQSPLLTEASLDGGASWASGTVPVGTMYGGDTVEYQIHVVNRANATIAGNVLTDITNVGATSICSDYTALLVEDPAGSGNWVDVSGACANAGPGGQSRVSISGTWLAFETEAYTVRATFNPAIIPDGYSIATTVTP